MVVGEGFAVDASLVEADADRQRSIPGVEGKKQIDPAAASGAVKKYLAPLNDAASSAATEVQPTLRARRLHVLDKLVANGGIFGCGLQN